MLHTYPEPCSEGELSLVYLMFICIHANGLPSRQAILSQFSQKRKSTSKDEDQEEELDDATLFKDLLDDNGVEDEEDVEPEDDDEVDPAVVGSDDRAIAEAVEGVDYSNCVPTLSADDIKLGRFSIFKVCLTGIFSYFMLANSCLNAASNSRKQNCQQPHNQS
jgi:hypothetical protein